MNVHLEVRGIEKSYRKAKRAVGVLHGVDLAIERGEMISIVGSSGSGKSTLLNLLGLLDRPDAGHVLLDGKRIDHLPERRRDYHRNHTFGFIFQFYHLLPELTTIQNVLLPLMIRHGLFDYALRRRQAARRSAAAMLERVGLGHRLSHYPGELSGGEMQRAAIARALAGRPQILLADEPTGNLDSASGQAIIDLLRELNREQDVTMVIVTHDAQIAAQADRTVRLSDGRVEEWAAAYSG
jgi:lipoprotein-releasing system ATP-binding protein